MQEVAESPQQDAIAIWSERLALSAIEIAAVERTGAIECERRGRSTSVYRLRYYLAGKRRTKYLGTQESEIQLLRHALDELNAKKRNRRHQRRMLASVMRNIRLQVERVRAELEPTLEAYGAYLHGRRIRQRRDRKLERCTRKNPPVNEHPHEPT